MIAFLSGHVLNFRGRALTLLVGGVGYQVFVNLKLLGSSGALELHIHTHQTSDTITLFGFATEDELGLFELLNSVNGVGPKTALEILEASPEKIRAAIASSDIKTLTATKGLGPKTAARIVLELRPKLTGADVEIPTTGELPSDALVALESLGYKKGQIERALAKLPTEITETEEIVKWFLSRC